MNLFSNDHEELVFYRQLFSSMNASVYVLNLDPYQLDWVAPNPMMGRIMGIDQEALLFQGDTIYGRLMDDPDFKESIVEAVEKFLDDPDVNWGGVYRIKNFKEEIKWIIYSTKTLIKDASGKAIKAVCVAIDADDVFCTPKTLEHFNEYVNNEIHRGIYEGLTGRQVEVLRGLTEGKNIKEISTSLNISPYTVVDHKKALFKKLNCNSVIDLVQVAKAKGLVRD